jgi:hypothetical protein
LNQEAAGDELTTPRRLRQLLGAPRVRSCELGFACDVAENGGDPVRLGEQIAVFARFRHLERLIRKRAGRDHVARIPPGEERQAGEDPSLQLRGAGLAGVLAQRRIGGPGLLPCPTHS